MKDRLEDYLVKHRHQFDVYDEPGDLLWQRIDRQLRPRRSLLRVASKWAAAIIILAGVGFLGISESISFLSENATTTLVEAEPDAFDPFSAEITQIESYYTSVINNQKDQLQQFREEGIELDPEDTVNLEHLQALYQNLQKELAYGEDKEAVIQAMVKNLMTQMEILQHQLKILENIKKVRNEVDLQV